MGPGWSLRWSAWRPIRCRCFGSAGRRWTKWRRRGELVTAGARLDHEVNDSCCRIVLRRRSSAQPNKTGLCIMPNGRLLRFGLSFAAMVAMGAVSTAHAVIIVDPHVTDGAFTTLSEW